MEICSFNKVPAAIAAAKKLGPLPDNFIFYSFAWLGPTPADWKTMKVTGAQFANRGKNTSPNTLTSKIGGTTRTAIVTKEEIADALKAMQ